MKTIILGMSLAAGVALAITAAQAQTSRPSAQAGQTGMSRSGENSAPTKAQKEFMTKAIQGDLAEVKVGELAQQKGETQAVKDFGKTLQQDHSSNLQKAQSVAQSVGMTAPSSPSSKQQAEYQKLSKLNGAAFDKEFAREMIKDHKKDISEYSSEAKKSGPVANFAQQTLPTLRKHLNIAEQLTSSKTTGSAR